MDETDATLSTRIIAARQRLGWTQRDLARQTGMKPQNIARFEHLAGDRQHIRSDSLMRLCEVLGVSADYLLGLTDDPRPRLRRKRQISVDEEDAHAA